MRLWRKTHNNHQHVLKQWIALRSLITVTTIELSLNLPPTPYAVPGIREANIKTVKENYGKGTANKKKFDWSNCRQGIRT